MDPGSEERILPNMVTAYCPEELPLLDGLGNAHTYCPRLRAATESVLIYAVMNHLTGQLEKDNMLSMKSTYSVLSRKLRMVNWLYVILLYDFTRLFSND